MAKCKALTGSVVKGLSSYDNDDNFLALFVAELSDRLKCCNRSDQNHFIHVQMAAHLSNLELLEQ